MFNTLMFSNTLAGVFNNAL